MVKFAYTILYVQDVKLSISFYERAFGLDRKFIVPDGSYGELITGDTSLAFASVDLARTNLKDGLLESNLYHKPFAIEVGFSTNDVDGLFQQALQAGAKEESAPSRKPHGQTVAYVRDLDGFLVEICTPMG